mmetsp:Transcript_22946/g.22272  ORF Transcript_22946/g.22272 Transcript_22946/m.22272 type:complete len:408 (+) Transcript_22946:387-1610(+)
MIRSYSLSGSSYNLQETSGSTLTITPTAGTLSSVSLEPTNSKVGATTSLELSFRLDHEFPSDGLISLEMPKWNSFAPTAYLAPILSVATSPGYVGCSPENGFPRRSELSCTLTVGDSSDTLSIYVSSGASAISSRTTLTLSLENGKAPPTLTELTGFTLRTTSASGEIIDEDTGVAYGAGAVGQIDASMVDVEAEDSTKIFQETALTIRIQNPVPMEEGCHLEIVIPEEFGTSGLSSVTGSGGRIRSNPSYELSRDRYTVSIEEINTDYLEALAYIYINLGTVTNPASTSKSSSFVITIKDPTEQPMVQTVSNVFYYATPGAISDGQVTANEYYINYNASEYTISFTPLDSFTSDAYVYLIFPDQINISNREDRQVQKAYSSGSLNVNSRAKVTVTENKYVTVDDLF